MIPLHLLYGRRDVKRQYENDPAFLKPGPNLVQQTMARAKGYSELQNVRERLSRVPLDENLLNQMTTLAANGTSPLAAFLNQSAGIATVAQRSLANKRTGM